MPFKKGDDNINRRGRPKNSLNKSNPQRKLQQALAHGYDVKKLKALILDLLTDKDIKLSAKERTDILRMALDTEVKLLKLAFDEDVGGEDDKPKVSEEVEDEDDDVVFSLKAQ